MKRSGASIEVLTGDKGCDDQNLRQLGLSERLLCALGGQLCESWVRINGVGCLLAHVARVEDEQDRRHVAVEPVGHDRSGMLGEFRLVVGE